MADKLVSMIEGSIIIDSSAHPDVAAYYGTCIITPHCIMSSMTKAKLLDSVREGKASVVCDGDKVYRRDDGTLYVRRKRS